MGFTQTNEKTAIACLTQHDWRLDIASDRFFQNSEQYFPSHPRPVPVDVKKIEQLFNVYRGTFYIHLSVYKLSLGD
jgi:DCN1-like protein 1/2